MNRMQRALCLAPLSGALLLCVWPAWGGGAKTDKKADEAAMAKSVADLAMAHKLIDFGRERGSAHALLLAAEILAKNPTRASDLKGEMKADPGAKVLERKDKGRTFEPVDLLKEAGKLDGAEKVVPWREDIQALLREKSRNPASEPLRGTYKVDGPGTYTLQRIFEGGKIARVMIRGDGYSDINLHIRDEAGTEVRTDTNPGDFAYVEWVPPSTQKFRIELRNLGPHWNQVTVISN